MRGISILLSVSAVACGSVTHPLADAGADAPGCQPKVLLTGGTDVAPQGWSIVEQQPATLTNGPDYAKLTTSTTMGATTGGQLLLHYPAAVETGKPFKLQVVMLVESVNPHNQFDSAAAIMGSFTPPFGVGNDRNEMIYLDGTKLGWGDNTQAFDAMVLNNAYHTYELSVDAAGMATVTIDGTRALTRSGFTFNGAIAVGDQTNEKSIDSVLRIKSVTRLCP